MSKIIIHNNSSLSDLDAIKKVLRVVEGGFQSGEKQYCWVTAFGNLDIAKHVVEAAPVRGNTHTFKVEDE